MKIYIYYLVDPTAFDQIDQEALEDFSEVMKSLNADHLLNKPGYYIHINGIPRYLYAFTPSKSIAKTFEEIHQMKFFNKIERKMDEEEYASFKSMMEHAYLSYEDSALLVTKLEKSILDKFFDEVEIYLSHYADYDYGIFKEEYIKALDFLLYTLYYQLNGPDFIFHDYNFSYGQTPESYPNGPITYEANDISNYYSIFKIILK